MKDAPIRFSKTPLDTEETLVKRSLCIAGHRTSISLETVFWRQLRLLAEQRDMPLATLVAAIDQMRGPVNLSSALRVFILREALKEKASAVKPRE